MPTNRRYKKREKLSSSLLTIPVRMILSSGIDFFSDLEHLEPIPKDRWGKIQRNLWIYVPGYFKPGPCDAPTDQPDARLDFLREQWARHKDKVLAWHIDKFRDGSRPWAWWFFGDAPEPYPTAEDGEDGTCVRRKLRAEGILLRHALLSKEEEFLTRAQAATRSGAADQGPDEEEQGRGNSKQ